MLALDVSCFSFKVNKVRNILFLLPDFWFCYLFSSPNLFKSVEFAYFGSIWNKIVWQVLTFGHSLHHLQVSLHLCYRNWNQRVFNDEWNFSPTDNSYDHFNRHEYRWLDGHWKEVWKGTTLWIPVGEDESTSKSSPSHVSLLVTMLKHLLCSFITVIQNHLLFSREKFRRKLLF